MRIPLFFNSIASLADEDLMARVASKDDDRAFDELYHRHARRVMGFIMRQLSDSDRAADLVQDAFLRLWSSRERYIADKCFSTWLFSLRFEEEMTVPQIAEVMKIPEGTVKSRQHTIIRNLKQKLKIYEIRR